MTEIVVTKRTQGPMVALASRESGDFALGQRVNPDYHAALRNSPKIWGAGSTRDAAIGSCAVTAATFKEVQLPDGFRSLPEAEVGMCIRKGEVSGITVATDAEA